MHRAVAPVIAIGAGVGANAIGSVVAIFADAGSGDASVVVPVFSAGGSLSIVGALIWLLQRLVSGELVSRRSAEAEADLAQMVKAGEKREADSSQREQDYRDIIRDLRRGNA